MKQRHMEVWIKSVKSNCCHGQVKLVKFFTYKENTILIIKFITVSGRWRSPFVFYQLFVFGLYLSFFTLLIFIYLCLFLIIFIVPQGALAGNYIFKVNIKNTRTRCEMCSKFTKKTPERRHLGLSGVFIVNFAHIPHLILVFLLLTLSR